MRVTLETKTATRQRILQTARRLFADNGFDATTTRDIALAADIATGTLFNYFPTKEAILACLAAEALADASTPADAATVDEALFTLIAAGMRKLKPFRKHLPVLLETALSPLAVKAPDESTLSLRTAHLEAVCALAAAHGHGQLSPTALQLYWSLYTGILAFWAADNSPKQEDTLALLDDSLDMYVAWLRAQSRPARGAS
jgi:AcrR family transcriptional regulator